MNYLKKNKIDYSKKLKIAVVGLIGGIVYGGFYFYQDAQKRIATLQQNNTKLEVVAKENGLAERTILIEFESFEAAVNAYESEAYQKALKLLSGGADRDVRLFEGVD